MPSIGKNNKWIILKKLEQNQEDIARVIVYMREELNTAHHLYSANGKNISSNASSLAEYKGYRQGMIDALTYAGFVLKFGEDGETLIDIKEMEGKADGSQSQNREEVIT